MTTILKCTRCGRDGHLPADCKVPVLPDDRVLTTTPLLPTKHDHPDVHQMIWTQTELVWIQNRDAQWMERITALEAEIAALYDLLPGPYYMDLPDGGDTTLLEQFERMAADASRYRLLRRGQQWSVIDGIGDTLRAYQLDAAIDAARTALEQAK